MFGSDKARKIRTPSGNIIENLVKSTRTIFSLVKAGVGEEALREDSHQSANKANIKCVKQRITSVKALPTRLSEQVSKQTVDSDSDCNYTTPPITPARTIGKADRSLFNKLQRNHDTRERYKMDATEDTTETDTGSDRAIGEFTASFKQIMSQDQDQQSPQTINLETVYEMFHKIEGKYDTRLRMLETERNLGSVAEKLKKAMIDELTTKVENLELSNKVLRRSLIRVCDGSKELESRVSKMEQNLSKKMITLSGLYTGEKKKVAIEEVEYFLWEEVGV